MTTMQSLSLLALAGVLSACQPEPRATQAAGADRVVATVGPKEITLSEIDAAIEPDLRRLEMERYQARKSKLDQMIEQALVAEKAKSLGVSSEELFTREVAGKVQAPTDEQVKEYYERFKDQLKASYEELAPRIRQALQSQAAGQRQREFVASLRKDAKVAIALEPPRAEVSTSGGVEKGGKEAPIELVEFSDFQCPYCQRSQASVKQVLDTYGNKVRHVFMDFPLTSIHPQALPAALAGRCASEQDKFWEYHTVLFERQGELSPENYKKWAGEIGLEQARFDGCLDAKKYEATVQQSLEAGQRAGVSGTPAFFVNGILIGGAQPFEAFQEVIEGELERRQG